MYLKPFQEMGECFPNKLVYLQAVRGLLDACFSPLFSYRSLFKSACSLSLLEDQQPENFCSTQHCLKCPHSNSLLLTVLWDTNVSFLNPARNW